MVTALATIMAGMGGGLYDLDMVVLGFCMSPRMSFRVELVLGVSVYHGKSLMGGVSSEPNHSFRQLFIWEISRSCARMTSSQGWNAR
jgi:hypothetical protein